MNRWTRTGRALVLGALAAAAVGAIAQTALPPPPGTAPPPAAPAATSPPAALPVVPAPAVPPATVPAPAAAADANAGAAPAAAPGATVVGSLELVPLKSTVKVIRVKQSTCLVSNIRFRMKNVSNSDIRVGLIVPTLSVTDDLGESLLTRNSKLLLVSGITALATEPREGWTNWISANSGGLTTVSPGQTVDAQVGPANSADWRYLVCFDDPSSEQFRSYRPASFSLTGTIGVADLDGNAQVRSFSFSEAPLQVIAR